MQRFPATLRSWPHKEGNKEYKLVYQLENVWPNQFGGAPGLVHSSYVILRMAEKAKGGGETCTVRIWGPGQDPANAITLHWAGQVAIPAGGDAPGLVEVVSYDDVPLVVLHELTAGDATAAK